MGSKRLTRRRRAELRDQADWEKKRLADRRGRRSKQPSREAPRSVPVESPYKYLNWRRIERFIADPLTRAKGRTRHRLLECSFPWFCWGEAYMREKVEKILVAVASRAPKLLDGRFADPWWNIARVPWIRSIHDWRPRGKSRDSLLRSLIDHLLVEYPVPRFLYAVFDAGRHDFRNAFAMDLFRAAARGESLYGFFARRTDGPVMTRRMSHLFSISPVHFGFFEAVRHAQVMACGGSPALARAICGTFLGREFRGPGRFWLETIRWLAGREDVDHRRLGDVFDYLSCAHAHSPGFSFKGRSFAALLRGTNEWHKELASLEAEGHGVYAPSGFKGGVWISKRERIEGQVVEKRWAVDEILTGAELAEEGKVMRHCVGSYGRLIELKICSIWHVLREGERRLTIEVDNDRRSVVQAKGPDDREPQDIEMAVLEAWARRNGLRMSKSVLTRGV